MISRLFTHTISVETFSGSGAKGPVYASPVSKAAAVTDEIRQVRNSTGDEVVSSTTVYTALADAALYVPGSRVTVNGRRAVVLSTVRRDKGPSRVHHTEVHLT